MTADKAREIARKTPNSALRSIREQERRETRAEFAEAMALVARESGERVFPDAKYVERLESGAIVWPRPSYRNILVKLCGRPIGELGFTAPVLTAPLSADVGGGMLANVNVPLRNAILASGMEVSQLARKVGVDPKSVQRWITGGRIPHPRHRWKACQALGCEESELWPSLFAGQTMLLASPHDSATELWHPAASELAPDPELYAHIASVLEENSHPDSAVISWLERCLAEHRRLEDTAGSAPIVDVVKTQLSVVAKLARQAPTNHSDRMVSLIAQYAQFMAWLCTDQGDKAAALAWYDRAHDWAIEAGDPNMAATTLSMKAHLAWSDSNAIRCVRLGEAARWNDGRTSPGVQGMATQMIARGHAIGSNPDSAHRAINEAQSLIMTASEHPEDEPPWMYFYGETWFTAQRGMIETELAERGKGNPSYAVTLLEQALNDLPEEYRRDRAWYGIILARAYAISDDCDAAAETGIKFAADAIDVNRYAVSELKQLSTTLNQRGVHQAHDLTDALATH